MRGRYFGGLGLVAMLLAALFPVLPLSAQSTRQQLLPAAGTSTAFTITGLPSKTIGDIELDQTSQRVFVSLPGANLILVFKFDSTYLGSVSIPKPTAMTLGTNALYVIAEEIGSIVRITPATLATSTVASGMNSPSGLTFNDGKLYTVIETGGTWSDRQLIQVDPSTGIKTLIPSSYGPDLEDLVDPSPKAGFLHGSYGDGISPKGMNSFELATSNWVHVHDSFSCAAKLDNGELLLGRYNELIAANSITLDMSNRRWSAPNEAASCDAKAGVVAFSNAGYYATKIDFRITEQANPGRVIRTYSLPSGASSHTRLSADASVAVTTAETGGNLVIFFLKGVTTSGSASQSAPTATTGRNAATSASGSAGSRVREVAPQGGFDPTLRVTGVSDWMIDPTDSYIYVTSASEGIFDVFNLQGGSVAAIRNLATPRYMTICGGQVYLGLRGLGRIVRVNKGSWTTTTVAENLPGVTELICVGSNLFATFDDLSPYWVRRSLYRIDPATGSKTLLVQGSIANARLGRFGAGSKIIGYSPYSFISYDVDSLAASASGYDYSTAADLVRQPIHLLWGGEKFLTSEGYRYDVGTMSRDGYHVTGYNPAVSQTSPSAFVAIRPTNDNSISIFDAADPTLLIRQFRILSEYELVDLEFVPGTKRLVALVRRLSDNAYFPSELPEIQASTPVASLQDEATDDPVPEELARQDYVQMSVPAAMVPLVPPSTVVASSVPPSVPPSTVVVASIPPSTDSSSSALGERQSTIPTSTISLVTPKAVPVVKVTAAASMGGDTTSVPPTPATPNTIGSVVRSPSPGAVGAKKPPSRAPRPTKKLKVVSSSVVRLKTKV